MRWIAWWSMDDLLMSTEQMTRVGLLDHVLKYPVRHGGIAGQLTLWL